MNQTVFQRYELKYHLTRHQLTLLRQAMEPYMTPDPHGQSTIQSLYFDTPTYLLVRRSIEHPVYKEKLRLRSYGLAKPEDTVFIELKKKFDSVVYKRRIGMTTAQARRYLLHGDRVMDTQITREIDFCMQRYQDLAPRMLLSYRREAWYGKDNHDLRITFDDRVLWRTENLSLSTGIYGTPLLQEHAVLMEVKVANAIPMWLAIFLSKHKIYKSSFSKYGSAYQAKYNQMTHEKGALRYA